MKALFQESKYSGLVLKDSPMEDLPANTSGIPELSKGDAGDQRFWLFSAFWATAVIFDLSKWSYWLASPWEFALSAAAFWALLRPGSTARLLGLAFVQVAVVVHAMPWTSNHRLFMALVCLAILIGWMRCAVATKGIRVDQGRWMAEMAGPIRLAVLLLYGFAFLGKLNVDWFDLEVSCGAVEYHRLADRFSIFPTAEWALYAAVYGSVAIEAIIPVFLLISRLRVVGLVIALVFHFVLGINTYFNFSAVMYASLLLFLPENFFGQLSAWRSKSRLAVWIHWGERLYASRWLVGLASVAMILFVIGVFAVMEWPPAQESFVLVRDPFDGRRPTLSYFFAAMWWPFALAATAVLIVTQRGVSPVWSRGWRFLSPMHWSGVIVPGLMLVNGLSPFLGIKSETSFAMFSNIRLDANVSNHLLVGNSLGLAGFAEDLVEVLDSSDPELGKLAERGYLLPYFEFRSFVARRKASDGRLVQVTYVRDGQRYDVTEPGDDSELFEPQPWWLRKFLYFRPVQQGDGPNLCRH